MRDAPGNSAAPCPVSPGLGEQPAGARTAPQLGQSGHRKVRGAFHSLCRAAWELLSVAPDSEIVTTSGPLVSPGCPFDTRSVTTHTV